MAGAGLAASDRRRDAWLLAAAVLAGGLAVPLSPIATPVSAAIAGAAAWVGLRAWRWSELPSTTLGAAPIDFQRIVTGAGWIGLGLLVGLLVLGVIRLAIEPVVPAMGARIATAGLLPLWRRILVIYVAAVGEELLFRLILLSAVAGLTARLLRGPTAKPATAVFWTANLLSAVAFSAAHLPSWSDIEPGTPWLFAAVLALNATGSIVLGWVFAYHGILAAMLTHAGADCAIQIVGPLTG